MANVGYNAYKLAYKPIIAKFVPNFVAMATRVGRGSVHQTANTLRVCRTVQLMRCAQVQTGEEIHLCCVCTA